MKKIVLYAVILAVAAIGLAGCGGTAPALENDESTLNTPSNTVSTPVKEEKTETASPNPAGWKAVLYFSDRDGMNIVKRERNISGDAAGIAEKAKGCIEELMKGADNGELLTTIPKAAKVLSVVQEKDTLVVDLSAEFEKDHVGGSTGIMMTMAPLVLTLTELEGVKQVSFKVAGKVLEDFKGHMTFTKPFTRSDFEQYITK